MSEAFPHIEAFVESPNFATFLVAGVILAITPGPGVIYILTQTLKAGRKAGLASVGGLALGNLGNASAASVGLAAVFAASSTAFFIVKIAGAAYLIFLGIKALRASPPVEAAARAGGAPPGPLFRDGLLVALLNPKTALFFAALLPQFIDPRASPLWQSLLCGGVFVAIALVTDTIYVFTASAVASTLRRRSPWRPYGRYVSAVTFIGLGIYAALASPRSAK
jgi:threonine/homoserine/homoserine lactone efflux protein